jgi:hypothetical protein
MSKSAYWSVVAERTRLLRRTGMDADQALAVVTHALDIGQRLEGSPALLSQLAEARPFGSRMGPRSIPRPRVPGVRQAA